MDIPPIGPSYLPPEQRKPGSTGPGSEPSDWVTNPTGDPEKDFNQDINYALSQSIKEQWEWLKENPHCSMHELDTKLGEIVNKWERTMLEHLHRLADKGGPAYEDFYQKQGIAGRASNHYITEMFPVEQDLTRHWEALNGKQK